MIANQRVNQMMIVQNLARTILQSQRRRMKMMQVMKKIGLAVMTQSPIVLIMMKLMCRQLLKQPSESLFHAVLRSLKR